jgi:queuine tRNA-ribosyltransferase
LGGLAVGESKAEREDTTEYAAQLLPLDKPRYLMGVGTPIDLLEAVRRGVDMFDCILPTAFAVQGVCFTSRGKIDLRRGVYRLAQEVLDPECACSTCQRFTRAYLRHLVHVKEPVAAQLLSVHNLHFYRRLMARMREAIFAGSFRSLYEREREILGADDLDNPPQSPVRRRRIPPHEQQMRLGAYEVVVRSEGYGVIRQAVSGEMMHSVNDPAEEAHRLYVEQGDIVGELRGAGPPLVIWDVGLGAATNAMKCIQTLEEVGSFKRELEIVSFERDLDPLRLATKYPYLFDHVRHRAPHTILREGRWRSEVLPISWRLIEGDFLHTITQAPAPDIIWFDPFSYKVDTLLWSVNTFQAVLAATGAHSTRLFTYSASTAVRSAMLVAGWFVGRGEGSGPKGETTVAYSPAAYERGQTRDLLDRSWLERWERSDAKAPIGRVVGECDEIIRGHVQFSRCSGTRGE